MSAPKVDATEFRQRYLATLRKQVAVNTKNLQANTLFKQTQQPTPLEDTRTITEKVADEQQLSNLLRKELSKLTDPASASAIVSGLSLADKKKLVENFGAVEEQLRRRFKFGFTKETFEPFFQKFVESLEETGGFAPTATQIAEKVAPAVSSAVAKSSTSDIFTIYNILAEMPFDEIEARYPDRSRKWTPIRNAFQDILLTEANAGNQEAKAFYDDITKRSKSDIKTGSAKAYARWYRALSADEQQNLVEGILGMEEFFPSLAPVEETPTASGRGLAKSSSSKNVVVSGGIPAEARFANFGRYLIDKGALKDNLAVIRFSSGACIHQIPKQKISANMSRVLKGIAGGALPSYDDMDSLNTDERKWLYDVSHRARLGINVPNPKKDEETREMEDFEKMKGQIIAGNDNKDLVKKFKLTLLKLAKEGRVPKREANEVLMELALVGL